MTKRIGKSNVIPMSKRKATIGLLASGLYEAGCDEELEGLLKSKQWKEDPAASLKYTAALLLFRKTGSSKAAEVALKIAFKANRYVPIYLSDEFEMPKNPPDYMAFGDESEAIVYVMQASYLWGDTKGADKWMAETLANDMRKVLEDKEAVEITTKADGLLPFQWRDRQRQHSGLGDDQKLYARSIVPDLQSVS